MTGVIAVSKPPFFLSMRLNTEEVSRLQLQRRRRPFKVYEKEKGIKFIPNSATGLWPWAGNDPTSRPFEHLRSAVAVPDLAVKRDQSCLSLFYLIPSWGVGVPHPAVKLDHAIVFLSLPMKRICFLRSCMLQLRRVGRSALFVLALFRKARKYSLAARFSFAIFSLIVLCSTVETWVWKLAVWGRLRVGTECFRESSFVLQH